GPQMVRVPRGGGVQRLREHVEHVTAQQGSDLADRHAPHPGRVACTQEVPADERERSAVCACPPPPRAIPLPPPVAAGPRR
ncbi:hypothetical protein AB0O04_37430, partial [Streptomyces althioticus]